jgi:hypothetical protein
MAACSLSPIRHSASKGRGENGKVLERHVITVRRGGRGDVPLPTLMPPRNTGTMLFIVSDRPAFGNEMRGGSSRDARGDGVFSDTTTV